MTENPIVPYPIADVPLPAPETKLPFTPREFLALLSLLLIALLLRLHHLGESGGLWLDEAWGVLIAGGRGDTLFPIPPGTLHEHAENFYEVGSLPWLKTWTGVLHEAHPPGFYTALRLWITLFGQSDFTLRLPAVLFSVGSLALLYLTVREMSGNRLAALLATILTALAPSQIAFAQECRQYMPMQFLLVALTLTAHRFLTHGPSAARLVTLALLLTTGMLTHYYFAGPAAGIIAYTLYRSPYRKSLLAAIAGSILLFALIWGPWAVRQHPWAMNIHAVDLDFSPFSTISRALYVPIHAVSPVAPLTALTATLAVIGIATLIFLSRRSPNSALFWAYLLGGTLFILTIDLTLKRRTIEVPRYTVVFSPALFALLTPFAPTLRKSFPALITVATALFLLPTSAYIPKSGWKPLGEHLASAAQPNDIIVYHSTWPKDWRINAMYLCLSRYAGPANALPQVLITSQDPLSPEIITRLQSAHRLWVLSVLPANLPPNYTFPFPPGFTELSATSLPMPPNSTNPLSLREMKPEGKD